MRNRTRINYYYEYNRKQRRSQIRSRRTLKPRDEDQVRCGYLGRQLQSHFLERSTDRLESLNGRSQYKGPSIGDTSFARVLFVSLVLGKVSVMGPRRLKIVFVERRSHRLCA